MTTARNALNLTPGSGELGADFFTQYDLNMAIIDAFGSKLNTVAVADPTVNEDSGDGYAAGSFWLNVAGSKIWFCQSAGVGAAVWRQIWPATATGADVDFGAYEVRAATFQSDVATGTAPMIVASTTLVSNLHAANSDALNGLADTAFVKAAGTVALSADWDAGSYEIRAQTFESDVATGTPPLVVASTTVVDNLHAANSDALGGSSLAVLTSALHNALSRTCQGRLTLETGVPVSVTDQTAKATIYFTPYQGDLIALYESSAWVVRAFTEASLSLADYVANKNYDIFGHWSGGVLTLESVVWTNDTTRETAILLQNGVYVKTGSTEKRYLGTIRTTATTGQCEDSVANRLVFNEYNKVRRKFSKVDTTNSWTYATASYQAANNSTANRVNFVVGNPTFVEVEVLVRMGSETVDGSVGFGLDRSNGNDCTVWSTGYGQVEDVRSKYYNTVVAGFHYLQWVEKCGTAATKTFYGDAGSDKFQSGILGYIES